MNCWTNPNGRNFHPERVGNSGNNSRGNDYRDYRRTTTVQGITTMAEKAVVIRNVEETVDMEVMHTSMMIVLGAEAGAALDLLVGAVAEAAATMMDTTLMIITAAAAAVVDRVRGMSEAGTRVTLMCPRACSIDGVRQLKVWRGGWI